MESANVEGEAAPSILWARWKLANVRVVMFRIPFSLSFSLSISAAADKFTAPLFYLPPLSSCHAPPTKRDSIFGLCEMQL